MSSPIPPPSNSDWHLKPQASYPEQSNDYRAQPAPVYQQPGAMPPQPYQNVTPPSPYQNVTPPPPYQNAYPPYPGQQVPQYQMPVSQAPQGVNVNIYNSQNAYSPQVVYDPYAGRAVAVLTLGIISLIAWIIPFAGSLSGLICSIVGICLFFSARHSTTRRGSAITGLVFCILALVISIVVVSIALLVLFVAQRRATP